MTFRRSRRSAFTLVELLVVIGIILVLMALLLPAINKAWNTAVRTRMAHDLQTISIALDSYRADFQQYPQIPANSGTGAYWLCRALMGPGDFNTDGAGPGNPANPNEASNGFRSVPGGKIWGPYLSPDSIKMGDPSATSGPGNVNNYVLMDKYRHPILYYPGRKGADITQPGGYLGPSGMFNPADNSNVSGVNLPATAFQILMGDVNQNGAIDAGETPAYTGNFVLWSPGPDEIYGQSIDKTKPAAPNNSCDDVANFPRY